MALTPPTGEHALFVDFDGTLAPLQDDPDTVQMSLRAREALCALALKMTGALAVVSGRDIRDLATRTPPDVWRAGGHGLEVCAPGDAPASAPPGPPQELDDAVARLVAGMAGVRIERKGPILAVHYRSAPERAQSLIEGLNRAVESVGAYVVQPGKMVVEAKPKSANKGLAVDQLMGRAPFLGRTPIMIGDDATDEDAFAVVANAGGLTAKVGEGPTRAAFRLAGTDEVEDWLVKGAGI